MRVRRAAAVLGIIGATAVLFFAGSYLVFTLERKADFADQKNRLERLQTLPSSVSGGPIPDTALDDVLPFNRLRTVGTHNSYRKSSGPLHGFFIELFKHGEAAKLAYNHPPLTVQLDAGIRSFELDLRFSSRGFECSHVPIVDDRSTLPDFALGLREIALWSERHPAHAPVTLLLELKDDYRFLDPALKPIGPGELDLIDGVIRSNLGSGLFEPDDLRDAGTSLVDTVARKGWPALAALRGRIMAILHHNERYRTMYLGGHPGLSGRAMFTSTGPGESGNGDDAVFAILNEPVLQKETITSALSRGMIVRTRADADGNRDTATRNAAVSSGAQIVSTDYPPAYPADDGYSVSFGEGSLFSIRR